MGKDYKQKYEAKCRQGIEEWKNAPINLQKKWDRWNFDVAEYRVLRLAKIEKEQDKIMNKELNEDELWDANVAKQIIRTCTRSVEVEQMVYVC